MRFEFELEGLLKIRRLLEAQALRRLEQSTSKIRVIEHKIEEAKAYVDKAEKQKWEGPSMPAAELQLMECALAKHREAIADCKQQKAQEEEEAARLQTLFLKARQERRTIDTLRDHAVEEFNRRLSRKEQSEMDDAFLRKRSHGRESR